MYRDDQMVAVAKPSGLLVHRGWGKDAIVAVDLIQTLLSQRVFPVHRLDRGTSGVLLFALNSDSARTLHLQFEDGTAVKRYVALVRGVVPESGVIDHPIPRREDGPRVAASTEYRRRASFHGYSLVEAFPKTGRLHQVRRHLKHISHPIIGDVNYGKGEHNRFFRERFGLHRLALHCESLVVRHPTAPETVQFLAPIPPDLQGTLLRLGERDPRENTTQTAHADR